MSLLLLVCLSILILDKVCPYAEHILDWFHVTMRITMMRQVAQKFLTLPGLANLDSRLESVKWYLWHGNVFRAQQLLQWMRMNLELYEEEEILHGKQFRRLCKAVDELETYINRLSPIMVSVIAMESRSQRLL